MDIVSFGCSIVVPLSRQFALEASVSLQPKFSADSSQWIGFVVADLLLFAVEVFPMVRTKRAFDFLLLQGNPDRQ